jgi:hypothetical protein
MKMVFFLGVFLIATLLSFGQTAQTATTPKSEQKKEQQHVKVMVSKNGQVTKIDTTFNFADEKVIKLKVDSILKKLEVVDGKSDDANVVIIRKDGKTHRMSHSEANGSGEQKFNVFYQSGDSGKMKKEMRVISIGDGGDFAAFGPDGNMMPPPPPPPPPYHVRGYRINGGDPFAMDPNNKDIISYDKKDIGKGLEKITIVRKKQTSPETKDVEVKVDVSDDKKK